MDQSPVRGFKPEAYWPNGRVGKRTNEGFITAAYQPHEDWRIFKEIKHMGFKTPKRGPGTQLHFERAIS